MKKTLIFVGICIEIIVSTVVFSSFTASSKNNTKYVSEDGVCTACQGNKTVTCGTCSGNGGKNETCSACKNNPSTSGGPGYQKNYRNGQWVKEKCGYCKGTKQTWSVCNGGCGGSGKKVCSSCKGTGKN